MPGPGLAPARGTAWDVTAEDVLALIPTASNYPDIVFDGLRPPAVH